MSSSRNFSRSVKRAAYARSGGKCENPACGKALPAGWGGIEYHHVNCWTLSHDSSLENCLVLCVPCHKDVTASHDRPAIDKNRRLRDAAMGIGRGGKKLPGGKNSAVRKKINGEVVERKSQSELHREFMERRRIGVER